MKQNWQNFVQFINKTIWSLEPGSVTKFQHWCINLIKYFFVLIRDLADGQINLRAMSLVFTTLLSLVPLLAVSFSVLKAFGVHNMIEPALMNFLAPLGEKGTEISSKVIGFVENIKVGLLGSMGLVFLMVTAVSLVQKVERSFNYIWDIAKSRPLAQRFSEYISVLLVGPVLVFSALGMTATLMNTKIMLTLKSIEALGLVFILLGKAVPYIIAITAFTFFYTFIPNTKVKIKAAIIGGVVAGVLWNTVGYGFAAFLVSSTRYTAIYSGFAVLILFILWIYMSWLILLIGCQIAYYAQHPQYVRKQKGPMPLSNRTKELIGFGIMEQLARHYVTGGGCTIEELAAGMQVTQERISRIMQLLQETGYVIESADQMPQYFPAKDLDNIQLVDLRDALRQAEEYQGIPQPLPKIEAADQLITQSEQAIRQSLGEMTLKELISSKEYKEKT